MAVTIVTVAEHHYEFGPARFTGLLKKSSSWNFAKCTAGFTGLLKKSSSWNFAKCTAGFTGLLKKSSSWNFAKCTAGFTGLLKKSSSWNFAKCTAGFTGLLKKSSSWNFAKCTAGFTGLLKMSSSWNFAKCTTRFTSTSQKPEVLEAFIDAVQVYKECAVRTGRCHRVVARRPQQRRRLEGRRAPTSLHVDSETKIRKLLGGCGASMDFNCVLVHYPYTDPFSDSQEFDFSSLSDAEAGIQDIT
ncbi:hypothetical protein SFRURICE_000066 [Spodoptera frugiperda]|nr:hypothetical protein SFRURICE_000066 [Spodoptera frugiperda]